MLTLHFFTLYYDSGWAQQRTPRGLRLIPSLSSSSSLLFLNWKMFVYPGLGLPSPSYSRRSKARDKQMPEPYFLGLL